MCKRKFLVSSVFTLLLSLHGCGSNSSGGGAGNPETETLSLNQTTVYSQVGVGMTTTPELLVDLT
jgi:hypothetical protein